MNVDIEQHPFPNDYDKHIKFINPMASTTVAALVISEEVKIGEEILVCYNCKPQLLLHFYVIFT